jgi:hypothetical protein
MGRRSSRNVVWKFFLSLFKIVGPLQAQSNTLMLLVGRGFFEQLCFDEKDLTRVAMERHDRKWVERRMREILCLSQFSTIAFILKNKPDPSFFIFGQDRAFETQLPLTRWESWKRDSLASVHIGSGVVYSITKSTSSTKIWE